MSTRKQLTHAGQFEIGQTVHYTRPDRVRRAQENNYSSELPYLESEYLVTRIETCDSGMLLWLKSEREEISAHLHVGIIAMKAVGMPQPFETIRIVKHAARQMEISA